MGNRHRAHINVPTQPCPFHTQPGPTCSSSEQFCWKRTQGSQFPPCQSDQSPESHIQSLLGHSLGSPSSHPTAPSLKKTPFAPPPPQHGFLVKDFWCCHVAQRGEGRAGLFPVAPSSSQLGTLDTATAARGFPQINYNSRWVWRKNQE